MIPGLAYAQATTTVTIRRGTTTDVLGDVVDGGAGASAVFTHLPMSIIPQRKTSRTPTDGRPQLVGYYRARVSSLVDLQLGDRVEDELSSAVWVVQAVDPDRTTSPAGIIDNGVDLRRVT